MSALLTKLPANEVVVSALQKTTGTGSLGPDGAAPTDGSSSGSPESLQLAATCPELTSRAPWNQDARNSSNRPRVHEEVGHRQ